MTKQGTKTEVAPVKLSDKIDLATEGMSIRVLLAIDNVKGVTTKDCGAHRAVVDLIIAMKSAAHEIEKFVDNPNLDTLGDLERSIFVSASSLMATARKARTRQLRRMRMSHADLCSK